MKKNLIPAVIAVVAALTLTTAAYAQLKPANADGITASPKVRQLLSERPAPAPSKMAVKACPQCTDVAIARLNAHAKGGEVMVGSKQVSFSHGCKACNTKLELTGVGKTRHQVASHQCTRDVVSMPGCCAAN